MLGLGVWRVRGELLAQHALERSDFRMMRSCRWNARSPTSSRRADINSSSLVKYCPSTGCKRPINKGERAFYYPNGKRMYGGQFDRTANPACAVGCGCGDQRSSEFESARADEAFYNA